MRRFLSYASLVIFILMWPVIGVCVGLKCESDVAINTVLCGAIGLMVSALLVGYCTDEKNV